MTDQLAGETAGSDRVRQPDGDVERALGSLGNLLLGEEPLEATLLRVAKAAVRAMPVFDEAAVTLVEGRGHRTAAYTNDETLHIDEAQYAAGQGPCLEAIRTAKVVEVDVSEAMARWPDFTKAAAAAGVTIFVGAPLEVSGSVIGALNLFGCGPGRPGDYDQSRLLLLCEQASVTLANAQRYAAATTLVEQLTRALESRAVIEQAKGVLMATHGVDGDAAFDLLRRRSQHANRKLREIAAEIVASARR